MSGARAPRFVLAAVALLGQAALPAVAADEPVRFEAVRTPPVSPLDPFPRWRAQGMPRLALALSGGAVRGVAHVGFLQALEEDGLWPDAVAGTSFGAIMGSFLASGYEPSDLQWLLETKDWDALLSGLDSRSRFLSREEDLARSSPLVRVRMRRRGRFQVGGLVDTGPMERELYRYLLAAQWQSGGDFRRLRVPLRVVATDILKGDRVVLENGNLVTAVRASSAVPGVFPPVRWNHRLLVDGLLVENVPVGAAREFGMDVVVAVDVTEGIPGDPEVRGALDLLHRSLAVMLEAQTRSQTHLADVLVEPEIQGFPTRFRGNVDRLVRSGREAYARARDRLWEVLEARAGDRTRYPYDRLEVEGPGTTEAELRRRLGPAPGALRIRAEVARLLNLAPVARASATYHRDGAARVLRFRLVPQPAPASVRWEDPGGLLAQRPVPPWPAGVRFSLREARRYVARCRAALAEAGRAAVVVDRAVWDPSAAVLSLRLQSSVRERVEGRIEGLQGGTADLGRWLGDLARGGLTLDRLADRMEELEDRGIVAQWWMDAAGGADGAVAYRVQAVADDYYELALTGEFRDALGWAGTARLAKTNVTGRGSRAEIVAAGGVDVQSVTARYRVERGVGLRRLGGLVEAGWFENEFPFVDAEQKPVEAAKEGYEGSALRSAVFRRFAWGGVVRLGVARHRERLASTAGGLPQEVRRRTSATLRLDLDRHDRLLFPTRGYAVEIRAERSFRGFDLWKAEILASAHLSPGRRRTNTFGLLGGAGLGSGADRRPYWFNPGGYRSLYGWIPYGAAAPQYARAGLRWRRRWADLGAARVYSELGFDLLRTADRPGTLEQAPLAHGWGASMILHTDFLGPVSFGAGRNENGADVVFVTLGYPLFDP